MSAIVDDILKEQNEKGLDFTTDIAIDKDALEYEWVRQASLMVRYSEEYANCMFDRDNKKDQLTIEKAKLDLEIRESWSEWGFQKAPTEAALANTILNQENIQDLMKEINQLNYELKRLEGMKLSLDHKKSALEMLSKLFMGGYYSTPNITTEAREKYAETGKDKHVEDLSNSPRIKRLAKKEK